MPLCLREPDWVSLMSDLHPHLLSLLRLDSMEAEMLGSASTLCPLRSMKKAGAWFTDSSFLRGRGVGGWRSIQGSRPTWLLLTHITHAQKGFRELCQEPGMKTKYIFLILSQYHSVILWNTKAAYYKLCQGTCVKVISNSFAWMNPCGITLVETLLLSSANFLLSCSILV